MPLRWSTRSAIRTARGAAKRALLRVPLGLWARVIRRPHIGFCWHVVAERELPHVTPLYRYRTPAELERDLAWLHSTYDVIDDRSLAERLQGTERRRGAARPAAVVTFDDALVECFTDIRPILQRQRIRGLFFVVTGCLDNRSLMYRHKAGLCISRLRAAAPDEGRELLEAVGRLLGTRFAKEAEAARAILAVRADRTGRLDDLCDALGVDVHAYLAERRPYLTRAQVRALHDDGHVIGAHGVDHRELQRLPRDEVERQIVESCDAVAEITGRTPVPFAVPFTLEGLDRVWLAQVVRRHPQVGLVFGTGGLKREPPGFFNRVLADDPGEGGTPPWQLPDLLRDAYLWEARRGIRRRLALARTPTRSDASTATARRRSRRLTRHRGGKELVSP